MCRTIYRSILNPRHHGHIRVRRALALAVLFGVALLAAAPFWGAPALQAQSQDLSDGLRFGPAAAAVTTAGLTLTAQNPGVSANFGTSVSNAGDVNGDLHDDFIVGCQGCDVSDDNSEGLAFIYFGGPLLDDVADVILNAPSPANRDNFGVSVSTAGDVNGDGFDDVIVGCYTCDLSGNNNEGKAFIFFGGLDMDGTADKTLSNPSPATQDGFGRAVSAAGDVNGDNYDDVIVGCKRCDMDVGKAFIFFGGPDMDQVADKILEPPPRPGGNDTYIIFGGSVSTAGDVNSDGYSDVIIGCQSCDRKKNAQHEGKAFIFFGGQNMDTTVDKILTPPSPAGGDSFGNSVATAGDVNGDGISDVIVGCVACDVDGIVNAGKAFIFFGGSADSPMDEAADKELHMPTPQAFQFFGSSVNTAGDLNGDGFADVVVGCHECYLLSPNVDAGQAFVFLGGPDMDEIVDETLQAPAPTGLGDSFGHSVSTAGDVNGDGFADLILGCRYCDIVGFNNEGKAFLRFGKAFGGTITGTVTDSSTNSPIQGATLSASTGQRNTTDASGEYTLNTVPAGNPIVTASASGFVAKSQQATVSDGGTVVLNFALEPDTTAVGTGTVKGKVTDANTGKNLAGVLVTTDKDQSATTGKSGRYTIENVPEGARTLTASKIGYVPQPQPAPVDAGQTTTLNFALVPQ